MNFQDYQTQAKSTAVYPSETALAYLALGLTGESGEVANKIKKVIRGDYDHDPEVAEEALSAIGHELGDVLWYVAVLADELGCELSDVALNNIVKLKDRQHRGTLKGSGDVR